MRAPGIKENEKIMLNKCAETLKRREVDPVSVQGKFLNKVENV